MNAEDNDPLWKLLGKADRKPEISPNFAQNVTRLVRELGEESPGFWRSLSAPNPLSRWTWARPALAFGSLAAIAITVFALVSANPDQPKGLTEGSDGEMPTLPIVPTVESLATVDPVLEGFGDELDRINQLDSLVTGDVEDVEDFADEEIAMLLF